MQAQQQSERINTIIVSVLGGSLFLLVAGSFFCVVNHLMVPEFSNNLATLVAGGLIGYLGAHRQSQPAGSPITGAQIDTVNVDNTGADAAAKGGG